MSETVRSDAEVEVLLTIGDLARRWRTTPQGVYAARHRGECPPAVRLGKRVLFRLADVVEFEEHALEVDPQHRRASSRPSAARWRHTGPVPPEFERSGMASIQKRPDGRWRARHHDPDGRERSRHFRRRIDAERWLAEVQADIMRGVYLDPTGAKVRHGA